MTPPARRILGRGKLMHHPDRLAAWRRGEVSRPLVIEVAITRGCNHNCTHCGSQMFADFSQRHFIDRDLFLRFLAEFRQAGGIEVFFAGSGEPLLHPHFPEFMRCGRELGLDMSFASNGAALTARRAEAILPHAAWVRFSVNGGDAGTYARVHGCEPEGFDRLWQQLAYAQRLRQEQGLGVYLALQCIVHEGNGFSLPGLVSRAEQVGIDRVVLRSRVNQGGDVTPLPATILELMRTLEVDHPILEVRWNSFPSAGEPSADGGPVWRRCHGIHFRTNMDFEGSLFSCARHYYRESRFGRMTDQSFQEIWNGSRRRELFALIEQGGDIPLCGRWCQVAFDNQYIESMIGQDAD
ncbi:MAG: radical SAM protein [Magnetococcales bacterium]|nr:radical SAM protein [Magnetococcales bacterium]